jgi:hypothetical protein
MGAYIRTRARGLIRDRKVPSDPGSPPHSHKGWLKNGIYFAANMRERSTIIGPELEIERKGEMVPRTLEYGGHIRVKNYRRRVRVLGGSGEVRIKKTGLTFTRSDFGLGPGRHRVTDDDVVYAKLRTYAQVMLANRLNEQLYGPYMIEGYVQPRPYMGPALEAEAAAGTINQAFTLGPG